MSKFKKIKSLMTTVDWGYVYSKMENLSPSDKAVVELMEENWEKNVVFAIIHVLLPNLCTQRALTFQLSIEMIETTLGVVFIGDNVIPLY